MANSSSAAAQQGDQGGGAPEAIRIRWSDFPVPGLGRRFLGAMIDGVIYFIISKTIVFGLRSVHLHSAAIGMMVFLLLYSSYWLAPVYVSGQTLGKKIMGLKIVTREYRSRLSFPQVLMREFIGKFISSLVFFMGYIWIFFNPERRAWHDMIGKTRVIDISGGMPTSSG